jgi:hypothetical protein
MKTKFLVPLLLLIVAFSNCKKDGNSSILSSRIWTRALNDKNPATNPSGRILYYAVQNCEKDDTYEFELDGKLLVNRNADKCDPNELQNETQSYSLNRATKELIINGNKFTLAEESRRQIKYYAPMNSGTGYDYIVFLLQ